MTEVKNGNATVRIHGSTDQKRLEVATLKFLKAAEQQKRRKKHDT